VGGADDALYEVSGEAQNDLFEIWRRIADDSVELANRIESEFSELFASPAQMPGQGHSRADLTERNVLFFPMYAFLIVYQADVRPIRIMAVLRGTRNVKRILRERSQ
jgi:plasmid stabilization system protein ParE